LKTIHQSIYVSLSQLYLDTELSDSELELMVSEFKNSGYDLSAIKEIDLFEVFPVLQTNLMVPAGVWDGFDEDWLIKECEWRKKKKWWFLYRLWIRFYNVLFYWMRKDYWIKLEAIWSEAQ
jgi:hypothetical protein